MAEGVMLKVALQALLPQAVVPAMLVLSGLDATTRSALCAGAGGFEAAHPSSGRYLVQMSQVL